MLPKSRQSPPPQKAGFSQNDYGTIFNPRNPKKLSRKNRDAWSLCVITLFSRYLNTETQIFSLRKDRSHTVEEVTCSLQVFSSEGTQRGEVARRREHPGNSHSPGPSGGIQDPGQRYDSGKSHVVSPGRFILYWKKQSDTNREGKHTAEITGLVAQQARVSRQDTQGDLPAQGSFLWHSRKACSERTP